MKILTKVNVDVDEVERIQMQLRKLQEMENCLSDNAIACYEIFRAGNTLYWIRILHKRNKEYTVELIKEEQ